MEQENITYGQYLKKTREDKQISIEQVARESKISLDVLHAIEDEDSERLPDDVFVRGFIRTYSEITDADPDVALKLYNPSYVKPIQSKHVKKKRSRSASDSKNGLKLFVMAVALFVIIICSYFGIRFMNQDQEQETMPVNEMLEQNSDAPSGNENNKEIDEKEKTSDITGNSEQPEDLQPEKPVDESALGMHEEVDKEKENERLTYKLSITCLEKTWMKIITDGEKPVEHTLKPGDILDLEAHSGYNLLIGNASGVKLKFNDTYIPVPGKSGQVVNINLP